MGKPGLTDLIYNQNSNIQTTCRSANKGHETSNLFILHSIEIRRSFVYFPDITLLLQSCSFDHLQR